MPTEVQFEFFWQFQLILVVDEIHVRFDAISSLFLWNDCNYYTAKTIYWYQFFEFYYRNQPVSLILLVSVSAHECKLGFFLAYAFFLGSRNQVFNRSVKTTWYKIFQFKSSTSSFTKGLSLGFLWIWNAEKQGFLTKAMSILGKYFCLSSKPWWRHKFSLK